MPYAQPPPTMPTSRLHTACRAALVAASSSLLLAACGGGGSGGTGSSAVSTTPTPVAPVAPVVPATPSSLAGVAAFGAPMTGATLSVIDAKGAVVGRAITNATDGSYALTLTTATPTLPLLLQAAGFDATGQPLLLHSALTTLGATAVANVTPLTDAAVALTLGTAPAKVFAAPAANATLIAGLAKVGAAADFVKTLVKVNLTDAKIANATLLDLFSDSSFSADKNGVDRALETLSIGIGTSTRGSEQLQLANKLGSNPAEVTVDLATAHTELAKATGATPASAITSTLKATTSPSTQVAKLPALDALALAINSAIAAGGRGALVTTLTASYVRHNGRNALDLADLVAEWADKNMQMGRMQVTGCADAVIAISGCVKLAVAARLIDAKGEQAGAFSDAVVSAGTATAPAWVLVGNGQIADVVVQPAGLLALNADGSRFAGAAVNPAANPRTGVQMAVQSNVVGAMVQTPGGRVLAMAPCDRPLLCIAATPGATSALAGGTPADQSVFQGSSAWLGGSDVASGAKYSVTLTPRNGGAVVRSAVLRNGFGATAPADGRFPTLDEVKPGRTLASATLLAGMALNWKTWADANPDMRLLSVRLVLSGATATDPSLVFDATPAHWQETTLDWAPVTVPDDFISGSVGLWLAAIDGAGRVYYTQYADIPVN